ncbi:MAG: hypothetical protein J3K34DRAFT_55283 [Monoraphidium minutum]|nr:MAG: hypothetical protein J3K34DRAFT_55283 [Monoraphidium minutum]
MTRRRGLSFVEALIALCDCSKSFLTECTNRGPAIAEAETSDLPAFSDAAPAMALMAPSSSLAQASRALRAPRHWAAARCPDAAAQRRRRTVVARTSEFWYEEEDEFDAVTEILEPKRVCLLPLQRCGGAAGGGAAALGAAAGAPFLTAFASPASLAAAERLWEELGRAGPPLFLKVRPRPALGALEAAGLDAAAAAAQADALWAELLSQSWRTELDHGLGKREEGAGLESILVMADAAAVSRLAAAAAAAGGGEAAAAAAAAAEAAAGGACGVEVAVEGWNQGLAAEQQRALESWKALRPRVAALQEGARA